MARVSRRAFLKTLGRSALALSAAGRVRAESSGKRLNFVFILVDDLGWADPTCYGSTFHETPNIDALAAQGMRFTNAYAAAPLCTATRASIMTGKCPARLHNTGANTYPAAPPDGRYPAPERTGPPWAKLVVPRPNGTLPLEEVTIAEALKPGGYATASIGKWHLGEDANFPEHQGFDVNFGGYREGWTRSHFYPYSIPSITEGKEGEYMADRLTDEAIKFMTAHRDGPFFLYLPHYAVHTPIQGKEEYVDYYRAKLDPKAGQRNPVYAAMIQSVDESVGRVMRALNDLGIVERTVVFLMSDNGGLLRTHGGEYITSNTPLRGGKAMLYEGGIREPMIVRWPGVVKPGAVCNTPISSIDFYSTILDMAGLEDIPGHQPDGISFVPLLKGATTFERNALFWHFPHYIIGLPGHWGTPCAAIRKGHVKLIKFFGGYSELYDLEKDLGETANLAEAMPERARALERELDVWIEHVQAQLPAPNKAYDPDYVRPGPLSDFDPAGYTLLKEWTFDEGAEGWDALHHCEIRAGEGHLKITSLEQDPYLHAPVAIEKGPVVVQIRAKFDSRGAGQLFWRSQKQPWHRSRSVVFHPVHSDGQWHEYAVRIDFSRPIVGFRLDPGAAEGHVAIDWIRVYAQAEGTEG